MRKKYSLKRKLLREFEEGIIDNPLEFLEQEEMDLYDEIEDGDVMLISPEDGEGDPQPGSQLVSDLADADVLNAMQDNFKRKKQLIGSSEKKNSLNESSLPRELSGGAGIILCILANFNSPKGWTTRDTNFFPGKPVSSYAKATKAQVTALSAHFGKNILPGAPKPPSGVGADLAFQGGCAAYPSGKFNGFESKSKTDHKGGTYELFKEFGDRYATSLGKALQDKKYNGAFSWAKKNSTKKQIANGIAGLSNANYKIFCGIVENHIMKEALLVPNYTIGSIWGATAAQVVSAWKAASAGGPKGNKIMVAQYSPTRRGISFYVPTVLVAEHPNLAARMTKTRADLLAKARAAGYNVAVAIKNKFKTEKKWDEYCNKSTTEKAKPRQWSQAIDPNQRANETNDIQAFFVKKGKKNTITFGNYKHAPGVYGGGYTKAYDDLMGNIGNSLSGGSGGGSGGKKKKKKKPGSGGLGGSGGSGGSGGTQNFFQRSGIPEKSGGGISAATYKAHADAILQGYLNGEVTQADMAASTYKLLQKLKAKKEEPATKKVVKKAVEKTKDKKSKLTGSWQSNVGRKIDSSGRLSKGAKLTKADKALFDKWRKVNGTNSITADRKTFAALAKPDNEMDKKDWAVAKESKQYSLQNRLLEQFEESYARNPIEEIEAMIFGPNGEFDEETAYEFLMNLSTEIDLEGEGPDDTGRPPSFDAM